MLQAVTKRAFLDDGRPCPLEELVDHLRDMPNRLERVVKGFLCASQSVVSPSRTWGAFPRKRQPREYGRVATYIHFRLVEHDQAAGSLVQDAVKDLVEDHLTQSARGSRGRKRSVVRLKGTEHRPPFKPASNQPGDLLDLDVPDGLLDQFGDVSDLDARVRFDDAHQVLLEQRVVQRREVIPDDRVVRQLCSISISATSTASVSPHPRIEEETRQKESSISGRRANLSSARATRAQTLADSGPGAPWPRPSSPRLPDPHTVERPCRRRWTSRLRPVLRGGGACVSLGASGSAAERKSAHQVEHDLAEEHVLERGHGARVVLARVTLECLEEVRVPVV